MTTSPHIPPDDPAELGARFVNLMLDSADPDLLGRDYWARARTALETALTAVTFPEAVSVMARKLQIGGALSAETGAGIAAIGAVLAGPAYLPWAGECRRDAVYVTALARIARDERRETRRAAKEMA